MDDRQLALVLGRARAVAGLVLVVFPSLAGWLWLGRGAREPAARATLRMLGIRDLVLGIGAITTVKEQTSGPEWVGMGAVVDGVDAVAMVITPGLPKRARLAMLFPAAAAALGIRAAKALAAQRDESVRAAAAAVGAETVA
ncbi:MAG TPA: hypothetical protein VFZ83_04995 [Acidimicrobiia bacterium]|nr:hypothetical protein [Acidimicrobiia bacterium]